MKDKNLSVEELAHLQEIYANKDYLTVNEAAIWLGVSPAIVRRHLKSGMICGLKLFDSRIWRVDVSKTKRLFDSQSRKNNKGGNRDGKK